MHINSTENIAFHYRMTST